MMMFLAIAVESNPILAHFGLQTIMKGIRYSDEMM